MYTHWLDIYTASEGQDKNLHVPQPAGASRLIRKTNTAVPSKILSNYQISDKSSD